MIIDKITRIFIKKLSNDLFTLENRLKIIDKEIDQALNKFETFALTKIYESERIQEYSRIVNKINSIKKNEQKLTVRKYTDILYSAEYNNMNYHIHTKINRLMLADKV